MNATTVQPISFEDLYVTFSPRIFGRVLYLVKDQQAAEDVTQEAFLKAWRAWPPAHATNLYGWLYQIATLTALDALRRERGVSVQPLDTLTWLLAHAAADPQTHYEGASASRRAALAHLPAEARCLLLLSADASARELAQLLGVNRRTLASHLSRLKAQAARLYHEEVSA
jgi:RNA polymerase sigma-70 factor, ECF subfamily